MLPHHPASVQPNMAQSSHSGMATSANTANLPGATAAQVPASYPDGPGLAPAQQSASKAGGPASGALSDLLGLENELTSIQVKHYCILNIQHDKSADNKQIADFDILKPQRRHELSLRNVALIPILSAGQSKVLMYSVVY